MKKTLIALLQVVAITLMTVGLNTNCGSKGSQDQNKPPYEACYEPHDNDGSTDCEK